MSPALWLLLGAVFGVMVGIQVMALLFMAREQDDDAMPEGCDGDCNQGRKCTCRPGSLRNVKFD